MVEHRWVDNVRYFEYTPLTLEHYPRLDGYIVARADVCTPDRRFRLALMVVAIERHAVRDRVSIATSILEGRNLLDRLVEEYRSGVDWLTYDVTLVFDLSGRLLH